MHAHYEHTENQSAYPIHGPHSVPLAKGNRQGHANANFLFLFSSSVSRHRVLSCCPRRTPSPGRAACGGALAPEPPRATRYQPEPIRTVPKIIVFFFNFLSWAVSGRECVCNVDFCPSLAQLRKKIGLSQLNPDFCKQNCTFWAEPAQPRFM